MQVCLARLVQEQPGRPKFLFRLVRIEELLGQERGTGQTGSESEFLTVRRLFPASNTSLWSCLKITIPFVCFWGLGI